MFKEKLAKISDSWQKHDLCRKKSEKVTNKGVRLAKTGENNKKRNKQKPAILVVLTCHSNMN